MVKGMNNMLYAKNNTIQVQMNIDITNKTFKDSLKLMIEKVDGIIDNELQKYYDIIKLKNNSYDILLYVVIEAKLNVERYRIKEAFELQLNDIYKNKLKLRHNELEAVQLESMN